MSDEIKLVFKSASFEKEVVPWLHELLGEKVVNFAYKNCFSVTGYTTGEDLYRACDEAFNPLLNVRLKRDKKHPTFVALVEWAMKDLVMKHPNLTKEKKDVFMRRVYGRKGAR